MRDSRIATFVIVHGGWGGGWEWSEVAELLRERGHRVITPTLAGMGDRAGEGGPEIGLETHVQDIVDVLEHEDLHDVVLCAHSYGGMPVTGAADRVPHRIGLVVYIDALVPRDGQSAFDLVTAQFRKDAHASAIDVGGGLRVPIPAELLPPKGIVPEAKWIDYVERLCDQPLRTFADPVRLRRSTDLPPRAFVRCTSGQLDRDLGDDPIAPVAARARAEGWTFRELAAPHDPQLTHPKATADLLDELVAAPDVA
ncbi:MAG: alpha/beta fold hydrolase [Actinobacteria bacterium]|nr:alpha/beta fold hydrolase [Actinomycetota bacterium]